ncbi:ParB/RepB/Spo0J family partition protein [uncultured Negativibacillus sp.]|uniref:ParB/RepB/Spo0J family partition protein n=1 Tax=uncultured Negativibacillus sp. TaxID=1980696 RepID=UPI0025D2F38C|nr:ParB/RepB/Spo0J family partition protein [uncultured Negativibacillus sp.]
MARAKKGGLGKGLDALFIDNETVDTGVVTLRLSEIEPNKEQPRKVFSEEALNELADSIKEHGVLQPLLVRPLPTGGYQLVAGERRWRASRMAGLQEVPVVIRDMDEEQAMEIALIENLQREDLNAIEEASGYKLLMERYGMTQEQVAKRVGKSRPAIANALRLLHLPQTVITMVEEGEVSPGHARALLAFEDQNKLLSVAQKVKTGKYSVRDIEKMSKEKNEEPQDQKAEAYQESWSAQETFFTEMELALSNELGRKVKIVQSGNGGLIQIQFYSEEDLKQLAEKMSK